MPPLPPVPAVVKLLMQTTNADAGYVSVNGIHIHYTGTAPTPSQLASFATTAATAWGSAYNSHMSSSDSLTGVEAMDLTSPTAATADVTVAHPGTLTGTQLADDVAFVLSAQVARRYRGGHPRSYLKLGDVTSVGDGRTWDSGFLTAVVTASAGLYTAIEGAGWSGAGTLSPVNVSYYFGYHNVLYPSGRRVDVPSLRVSGPVVDQITGFVGRPRFGTQRRRLGV